MTNGNSSIQNVKKKPFTVLLDFSITEFLTIINEEIIDNIGSRISCIFFHSDKYIFSKTDVALFVRHK